MTPPAGAVAWAGRLCKEQLLSYYSVCIVPIPSLLWAEVERKKHLHCHTMVGNIEWQQKPRKSGKGMAKRTGIRSEAALQTTFSLDLVTMQAL